ncbi:MAG: LCP family protein [Lachnospiraceae bacterium]|nr:LCP family protein [Lachnospiraceae bacterium]
MARKNQMRGSTRQQRALMRKKKKRKRAILVTIELFILAILGVGAYGMFKLDKIDTKKLNEKNLEAYHDTGPYTNIALFGLDSREGEVEGGVQSDAMMIASINNKTSEVKLISVYRDTLLQQADGGYNKANSAYNTGGPEEAIALLNRNLDLDIKKYVSVNFDVMIDVIDALGGVQIDVAEEEISEINGYAQEVIKVTGVDSEGVFEPGVQTLNGVQATAYARIRHVKGNTSGNDFGRTERQRAVLEQIFQKAQSANVITLNKLIDKVLPKCSTNFTSLELMGVAANVMNYKVGGTTGFPFDVTTSEDVMKHEGISFVVPVGFASNVQQLHEYLFADKSYVASDKVTEVNNDIIYLTGIDKDMSDSNAEGN